MTILSLIFLKVRASFVYLYICETWNLSLIFLGKYQDCFLNDNDLKQYVFPFLNVDDPYEATKEEILRAKWLEENKILHGDFKPAKQDKGIERVTKQQLPEIVNYIKKVIMVDWAEVNFIIGTNPDSFIEIKFD